MRVQKHYKTWSFGSTARLKKAEDASNTNRLTVLPYSRAKCLFVVNHYSGKSTSGSWDGDGIKGIRVVLSKSMPLSSVQVLRCLLLVMTAFVAASMYRDCFGATAASLLESLGARGDHTLRMTTTAERHVYPATLPSVAWLLTYMGSNDLTLGLVQHVTGTSTATNYALSHQSSVPLQPNYASGPFIADPLLPLPTKYILTQTYCGSLSFCLDHCLPLRPDSAVSLEFAQACTSGRMVRGGPNDQPAQSVAYSSRIPQRAVHVIHNPFDTVWNRMSLVQQSRSWKTSHKQSLSPSQWCRYLDERNFEPILMAYQNVPCASEWYRYIQWHNMVLSVIPTKILSRNHLPPLWTIWGENLTASVESYSATMTQLLDVLQFESTIVSPNQFRPAAMMDAVWDTATKRAAAQMMQDLASNATWAVIRHYLEPYLNDAGENEAVIESSFRPLDKHLLAVVDDSLLFNQQYGATTLPEPNDSNPQVVWLMSFPNSGTTYTRLNVEQMSNVTAGSNYARDWTTAPTLLLPDSPQGPFLYHPERRIPHNVLTKTHCHGYCDDCLSLVSNDDFLQGCLRSEFPNGTDVYYNASIPAKAVHLIRNPFDNIVARMHHAVKCGHWTPDQPSLSHTKAGLTAWCDHLDTLHATTEQDFFPSHLWNEYMRDLPCRADWHRYVTWHNHAFALTASRKLPVHVLMYEDYTNRFDETVVELLNFLDLDARQPPVEFFVGKSYEHFFDVSVARQAAAFVQAMASNDTWTYVRHYFAPFR